MFAFAGGFSASGGRHEAAIQVAVQTETKAGRHHQRSWNDPIRPPRYSGKENHMRGHEDQRADGPERDAFYLINTIKELSKLDDADLAVVVEDMKAATALLIDRIREYERRRAA